MTSSFGRDPGDIEQQCLVCGAPTKSHPAPNGYFCHSCVSEQEETALLEALPVAPLPELRFGTGVDCYWCGASHTLDDANIEGRDVIKAGVGYPIFDTLGAFVWVSCPTCAKATEYLTTRERSEEIAQAVRGDLHQYSRRGGWS